MLSRPNNRIEGHPAAVDELNYGPFHPRYNLSLGRMERAYILRSLPLLKLGPYPPTRPYQKWATIF